jgi:hypothetical protein
MEIIESTDYVYTEIANIACDHFQNLKSFTIPFQKRSSKVAKIL